MKRPAALGCLMTIRVKDVYKRQRVYNGVDVIGDIFRTLPILHGASQRLQMGRQGGALGVGAGNAEIFLEQNLGQAAHADAADADEMDVDRFMEINLKHKNPSCSSLL